MLTRGICSKICIRVKNQATKVCLTVGNFLVLTSNLLNNEDIHSYNINDSIHVPKISSGYYLFNCITTLNEKGYSVCRQKYYKNHKLLNTTELTLTRISFLFRNEKRRNKKRTYIIIDIG